MSDTVCRATLALADAMDAEGITENRLAGRLGVSRQSVNNWFGGGVRTIKALTASADVLGYDVHIELRKRQAESVAS